MSDPMKMSSIELVKEVAENIRTCLYCSNLGVQEHARPMSTVQVDEDGSIWFFTSSQHEVAQSDDDLVHLLYSDNGKQQYLAIKGEAKIVSDENKVQDLWNPILNAWFPEGIDTPDLRLLRVSPKSGEYWKGVSMVRTLFDAVKAKLTGEEGTYGEHKNLKLG